MQWYLPKSAPEKLVIPSTLSSVTAHRPKLWYLGNVAIRDPSVIALVEIRESFAGFIEWIDQRLEAHREWLAEHEKKMKSTHPPGRRPSGNCKICQQRKRRKDRRAAEKD